ncbi:response regulator [Bilophila wadsworthia]|uniref:response regulator n=1 Tax=Bilophila wadsworthia TaxID=35833 RepID=UPI00242DD5D4|nr:response regulator [Bilophila wadsworthia]
MLAEDNELNREIAEELLKTQGLSVSCAENGQIAVDMFKSSPSPPGTDNIILMDSQIPRMDGYQTAAIRSAPYHPDAATIPIIAMTTNTFSEDVATAAAAGMR